MGRFSGYATIAPQTDTSFSESKEFQLGVEIADTEGNVYRYARFAANPAQGKFFQSPAQVSAHSGLVIAAAAAVGATTITITNGATVVTANQYAEGYVTVQTGTGLAQTYKITGNSAAAGSGVITVYLDLPLVKAIPAASTLSLQYNKYDGVVVATTSPLTVVGLCVADGTLGSVPFYGWLQVKGIGAVIAGAAITAGVPISASNSVAGSVEDTAAVTEQVLGFANTAITSTQGGLATLSVQ